MTSETIQRLPSLSDLSKQTDESPFSGTSFDFFKTQNDTLISESKPGTEISLNDNNNDNSVLDTLDFELPLRTSCNRESQTMNLDLNLDLNLLSQQPLQLQDFDLSSLSPSSPFTLTENVTSPPSVVPAGPIIPGLLPISPSQSDNSLSLETFSSSGLLLNLDDFQKDLYTTSISPPGTDLFYSGSPPGMDYLPPRSYESLDFSSKQKSEDNMTSTTIKRKKKPDHIVSSMTSEEKFILEKSGFCLSEDIILTKKEEKVIRAELRKVRNKASAKESRRKKSEYLKGLESRLEKCTATNSLLLKRCQGLEQDKASMSSMLSHLQQLLHMAGTKSVNSSLDKCKTDEPSADLNPFSSSDGISQIPLYSSLLSSLNFVNSPVSPPFITTNSPPFGISSPPSYDGDVNSNNNNTLPPLPSTILFAFLFVFSAFVSPDYFLHGFDNFFKQNFTSDSSFSSSSSMKSPSSRVLLNVDESDFSQGLSFKTLGPIYTSQFSSNENINNENIEIDSVINQSNESEVVCFYSPRDERAFFRSLFQESYVCQCTLKYNYKHQ